MTNSAPGFQSHPDRRFEIQSVEREITIRSDDVILGKTTQAVQLYEADYPVVYYVPLATLDPKLLEASDHSTYCPFKGEASYFHLVVDGRTYTNAVWSYKEPYDEAAALKELIAFYPNAAQVEV